MPTLETYRKQAKRLVRWHRQANYSVGEKLRVLPRYRHVTDREALDMAMPLTLAQEIVAVQAGFADWGALKAAAAGTAPRITADDGAPDLIGAIPILFVRNVADAARFYGEKLGFIVDFLHGNPPFYGAVSRDGACLHLRLVHRPNFSDLAGHETSLILVTIETRNVKALFEAFSAQDIDFAQRLVTQPWGGTDFHVRDPDGNVISSFNTACHKTQRIWRRERGRSKSRTEAGGPQGLKRERGACRGCPRNCKCRTSALP